MPYRIAQPVEDMNVSEGDVLIVGGGFAGTWCARRLEHRLGSRASVTLVSRRTTSSTSRCCPTWSEPVWNRPPAISPLRYLCRHTTIVRADVRDIDVTTRTVKAAIPGTGSEVQFRARHLVLALGSIVDISQVPGLSEYSLLMKNVADALALRQTLIGRLERALLEPNVEERAALLTFVVIGGGFSGVETAAAMLDFLSAARRYYAQLDGDRIRVVCVHSGSYLMPEMRRELGELARRLLIQRGLEIRLDARASSVTANEVLLANGSRIATRTIVCTIGNAPHPALQTLGVEAIRGLPVTDEYLRLKNFDDVWAIGDCARAPDGRGGFSVPTAQFAVRHGRSVADNIARGFKGREPQPFRHKSLGTLASLGHRSAVAQIGPLRFRGFVAWWLWRMVYLAMLPRVEFKLRVALDWTLDLFFPRDINYVDVRVTPAISTLPLAKEEVLFRQGDTSDSFYVIVSGAVELEQRNAAGEVVLREVLGPGAHFGEGSLLRSHARTTSARALEASWVARLGSRDFEGLMSELSLLHKTLEVVNEHDRPDGHIVPPALSPKLRAVPIKQIMTTPVKSLPEAATLRDALATMERDAVGCYPVVDAEGRIEGLTTRTDLYAALDHDIDLERPLLEICSTHLHLLGTDDTLGRSVDLMRATEIGHLPVLDGERRLVGMVSRRDIARETLRQRDALVGLPVPRPTIRASQGDYAAQLRTSVEGAIPESKQIDDRPALRRLLVSLGYVAGDYHHSGTLYSLKRTLRAAGLAGQARGNRKPFRPRPRFGARPQSHRDIGLRPRLRLPHRPLPRKGRVREHPALSIRQLVPRADLNRNYVSSVQTTLSEDFGVTERRPLLRNGGVVGSATRGTRQTRRADVHRRPGRAVPPR